MRAWWAQSRAEVRMTLRRGETLLLTVGIPVVLLVFFSLTKVTSTPTTSRVDFIAPGILALCVLSTSLVALSIATGFERAVRRAASSPRDADRHAPAHRSEDRRRARDRGPSGHHPHVGRTHADLASPWWRPRWT